MKRGLLILIVVFIIASCGCVYHNTNVKTVGGIASNYHLEWNQTYSDTHDNFIIPSLLQTNDSGYIIIGHKDWPIYIAKIDPLGNIEWNRTYNSIYDVNYDVGGRSSIQANDSGYMILCNSNSNLINAANYVNITNIDFNGSILYNITCELDNESPYSFITTSDGNFLITGSTIPNNNSRNMSAFLIKIDKNGHLIWNHIYDMISYGVAVKEDPSGGYLLYSGGGIQTCLLKTDENGSVIWEHQYDGYTPSSILGVSKINDDGYIICSTGHDYGIHITKVDNVGNEQWNKTYSMNSSGHTMQKGEGISVYPAPNNTYLVVGFSNEYHTSNIGLFNIDQNGQLIGNITFIPVECSELTSIYPTADNGFICVGARLVDKAPPGFWEGQMRENSYIYKIGYNQT